MYQKKAISSNYLEYGWNLIEVLVLLSSPNKEKSNS